MPAGNLSVRRSSCEFASYLFIFRVTMDIFSLILGFIHFIVLVRETCYRCTQKIWKTLDFSYFKTPFNASRIHADSKTLNKLPIHIGFLILEDDILYYDLASLIIWSVILGISYITVYDRKGKV